MRKKAILVVSFGTACQESMSRSITAIEDKFREKFPDYDVRHAFTSRKVIKSLAEEYEIHVDTEKEAIERLQSENYKEIVIQPLHIVVGEEYDKVKWLVSNYVHSKTSFFDIISIGRPLLYYTGRKGKPDDYLDVVQAMQEQIPALGPETSVIFMGRGGIHPANTAYAALQMKLECAGLKQIFVYTIEGFPELDLVMAKLKEAKMKKVILMPFMLTGGQNAFDCIAGQDEVSAESQLHNAGFEVEIYLHGLGENKAIQDLYVQHLQDAITQAEKYKSRKH